MPKRHKRWKAQRPPMEGLPRPAHDAEPAFYGSLSMPRPRDLNADAMAAADLLGTIVDEKGIEL